MIEGCDFFIWNLSHELNLRETLNKETITKLEAYAKELKSELSKRTEGLELKNRALEQEKAILAAKEQTLKEQIGDLKREKENQEKDLKERIQQDKQEAGKLVEEYKQWMYSQEETYKNQNRDYLQKESEYEKKIALLD